MTTNRLVSLLENDGLPPQAPQGELVWACSYGDDETTYYVKAGSAQEAHATITAFLHGVDPGGPDMPWPETPFVTKSADHYGDGWLILKARPGRFEKSNQISSKISSTGQF